MSDFVAVPVKTWSRIERLLDRLDKDHKTARKAEWISTGEFMKRTDKSKEQVRYMRESTHPTLFRQTATGRYEIDWIAYQKTIHS